MELNERGAEHLAEVMRGLATPSRLLMLARLDDSPCSVTALVEATGIPQATASNHLRTLRHLNLVVGRREGKSVVYSLADEHVRALLRQAVGHLHHAEDDEA